MDSGLFSVDDWKDPSIKNREILCNPDKPNIFHLEPFFNGFLNQVQTAMISGSLDWSLHFYFYV